MDIDVEFRDALSTPSTTTLATSEPVEEDEAEDVAPPADPMQVDEAVSPNPEVSISDSISEHTSTTTTSSDSTLTLDAAAPGMESPTKFVGKKFVFNYPRITPLNNGCYVKNVNLIIH